MTRSKNLPKFGVELEVKGLDQDQALHVLEGTSWRAKLDNSMVDGVEVCSGKLATLRTVPKVTKALRDAGAFIDSECALHVHVACAKEDLYSLSAKYARHEYTIDTWHPKARRGDNNKYCLSCHHPLALVHKYHKLNVTSWYQHSTVEFRQHHGTLQDAKIVAWVNFCRQFVVEPASAGLLDGLDSETVQHLQARTARLRAPELARMAPES